MVQGTLKLTFKHEEQLNIFLAMMQKLKKVRALPSDLAWSWEHMNTGQVDRQGYEVTLYKKKASLWTAAEMESRTPADDS